MKHGDKTKGKASKASGKKASQSGKGASKVASKVAATSKSKSASEKASPKSAAKPKGGNGPGAARSGGDGFSNPIVGAAFKHAVKKYPNAFRKLTD